MVRDPVNVDGKPPRDHRIDLMRGVALLVIFTDHLCRNNLAAYTLHSFALCDAAEFFVFLSGCVSGLVYGRVYDGGGGFAACRRKALRRFGELYLARLSLFVLVSPTLFALSRWIPPAYHDFGFGEIWRSPAQGFLHLLCLTPPSTSFGVLPLYMFLLLVLAPMLALGRRSVRGMMLVSLGAYLAAQCWGARWPDAHRFNPLAWQLLFVAGMACGGFGRWPCVRVGDVAPRWWTVVAALVVCIAALAVRIAATARADPAYRVTLSGLLDLRLPRHLPLPNADLPVRFADKPTLGPLRLVSFVAVFYLCWTALPRGGSFFRRPTIAALVRCGRHSLPVFCLAVVLDHAANVAMSHGQPREVQVLVNAGGWALLLLFARVLDGRGTRRSLAARDGERCMTPHHALVPAS